MSLSDLFSCSVSVRVSTELERLDRQELLPDDLPKPPRPHSRMARSGDITAWLSVSRSWAVPTENPRWGSPISEQKVRPRRDGGSQIPSWRRLKCWPKTEQGGPFKIIWRFKDVIIHSSDYVKVHVQVLIIAYKSHKD